jgi:Ferritin-like domain
MDDNQSLPPALAGVDIQSRKMSRGEAILKGTLAVGTLYGLGAVAPYARAALVEEGATEIDILNYLLSFEHLLISIYSRGLTERNDHNEKMSLEEHKPLIETLVAEEREHMSAMRELIEGMGGKPVERIPATFDFRELKVLLTMSAEIEGFTIGAYNGVIPSLKTQEARKLTSSIVQVEGRHAATLLLAAKEPPAPDAFDRPESQDNSINAVGKFTGVFS